MTSHTPYRVNKPVLVMMFAAVAAMFAWSFIYRADNPSLIAAVESRGQAPAGMPGGMPGGGAMNAVMGAMAKLQANPEDVGAMEEAAEAFAEAEMWDKTLAILEKASTKAPDEVHILNLYGVTLFRLERPAEAAKKFERLLELDASNFHAQFNLGAVHKHGLQDAAKARKYFEAVLANPKADAQTKEQARQELESPQ
ncbi:MAG: tetratricopeptide repeat protein [Desulfovibrio sp.]|nr:tetratricopeptide repeat protein [Desulfovibrio sp.]MBI4959875.1 tetratricopeptide repeat protein [Desulfovibrio sp.]